MLTLLLILLVTGIALTAFLYFGTIFLQGYIYTEPNPAILWGIPVAGLVLTSFLTVWCLCNALSSQATPRDIPYDSIFTFNPRADQVEQPVKRLWAIKRGGKTVEYTRQRLAQTRWEYRDTTTDKRPWNPAGVEAVEIERDGQKLRFDKVAGTQGDNDHYTSADGWSMTDYGDGPSGIPSSFRYGRFLANLVLNGLHVVLWFVCLWLLLRYLWAHALGLAFVIWLVITLTLLPMLLSYSAEVAVQRQQTSSTQAPG